MYVLKGREKEGEGEKEEGEKAEEKVAVKLLFVNQYFLEWLLS